MTPEAPPLGELEAVRPYPARMGPKGNLVYKLITTTDHKMIGMMYVVTCFAFFFHRRSDGAVDAFRAVRTGPAIPVERAVQPAVHHARHDHAAALFHPDRVRVGAIAAEFLRDLVGLLEHPLRILN